MFFGLVNWFPSFKMEQETLHLPHFLHVASESVDFDLGFWFAILFKFQIEQVKIGDQEALAWQEVYWQNQLRGYVQNGGMPTVTYKRKTV